MHSAEPAADPRSPSTPRPPSARQIGSSGHHCAVETAVPHSPASLPAPCHPLPEHPPHIFADAADSSDMLPRDGAITRFPYNRTSFNSRNESLPTNNIQRIPPRAVPARPPPLILLPLVLPGATGSKFIFPLLSITSKNESPKRSLPSARLKLARKTPRPKALAKTRAFFISNVQKRSTK